jgi:hypothetical protein
MKAKSKAKLKPGQQPHEPTRESLATVKAMAGVGYSQMVIARHIGISEPTLRVHYRELLDNATESICALVFANLVKTATTKNDNASVQAAKVILAVRAPAWVERTKLEVEDHGKGLSAILKIVADAKRHGEPGDAQSESWPVHFPN